LTLNVLSQTPDFSNIGQLTIHALAPLSMVARMPGKYYRCQPAPTNEMLFGLLENALGWHIAEADRDQLIKQLNKQFGAPISTSGVGYRSLLQYHVRIGMAVLPSVTHYSDLWSQHLHGASFVGGSREYSFEAIPIMGALAGKRIAVNDLAKAGKDLALLTEFEDGQTVHLNVLRPYFPQYYVSPTLREYVLPNGPYRYRIETSRDMAELLALAIADPAAPLYLGSNDGWVDVEWRQLS
jgi:CRISPR-associated protein Cas5